MNEAYVFHCSQSKQQKCLLNMLVSATTAEFNIMKKNIFPETNILLYNIKTSGALVVCLFVCVVFLLLVITFISFFSLCLSFFTIHKLFNNNKHQTVVTNLSSKLFFSFSFLIYKTNDLIKGAFVLLLVVLFCLYENLEIVGREYE